MGWIGSGVRVNVSFLQKYPPYSVLRCLTAAKNGGYDQGGCAWGSLTSSPAYNVEPATAQTLRRRLVRTTTDAAVSARRSPSFVAALFFTLRDSYG